jgi:hypothetical protein
MISQGFASSACHIGAKGPLAVFLLAIFLFPNLAPVNAEDILEVSHDLEITELTLRLTSSGHILEGRQWGGIPIVLTAGASAISVRPRRDQAGIEIRVLKGSATMADLTYGVGSIELLGPSVGEPLHLALGNALGVLTLERSQHSENRNAKKKGRECCVTCGGITVCGCVVSTDCGSCCVAECCP